MYPDDDMHSVSPEPPEKDVPSADSPVRRVLLTGATGYVGGRLLPVLESRGVPVRCVTRRAQALTGRVAPGTDVMTGDLRDPEVARAALEDVDVAYYLVHALGARSDFATDDRAAAEHFAAAARTAGIRRIVYLGGLGSGPDLSEHLASRQEVGRILRASGVPTIELRASIVIGSGSISFELIRSLVHRLPVMLTPRWVRTETQPIAIDDVVDYLAACLDVEAGESRVYEIGGPDRVTYGDLMAEYARQSGLRRRIVPVPVLSPTLSSLWLGLITPVYARVGRQLVDGVRNRTVVENPQATRNDFPGLHPRPVRDAIADAIRERDEPPTRWADMFTPGRTSPERDAAPAPRGAHLVDARRVRLPISPADAFRPVQMIGGRTGWYFGNALWTVRGFLDLLVGGVGVRRGRRHPVDLRVGEALDFWRVEAFEPDRLLRLCAEMRLPGKAWLEFRVEPDGSGAILHQTATFEPKGFAGRLYWLGLSLIHGLVFPGMLRRIAKAAVGGATARVAR